MLPVGVTERTHPHLVLAFLKAVADRQNGGCAPDIVIYNDWDVLVDWVKRTAAEREERGEGEEGAGGGAGGSGGQGSNGGGDGSSGSGGGGIGSGQSGVRGEDGGAAGGRADAEGDVRMREAEGVEGEGGGQGPQQPAPADDGDALYRFACPITFVCDVVSVLTGRCEE